MTIKDVAIFNEDNHQTGPTNDTTLSRIHTNLHRQTRRHSHLPKTLYLPY